MWLLLACEPKQTSDGSTTAVTPDDDVSVGVPPETDVDVDVDSDTDWDSPTDKGWGSQHTAWWWTEWGHSGRYESGGGQAHSGGHSSGGHSSATVHTGPSPFTVCDQGAPYSDLQSAIDAALPGDTVTVCAGNWGPVVVGADLTLVGEDAATTFLEAGAAPPAVSIVGGVVSLSSFTLTGTSALGATTALSVDSATLIATDVVVSSARSSGNAVTAVDSSVTLDGTTWVGNAQGSALLAVYGGSLALRRSLFTSNGPDGATGGHWLAVFSDSSEVDAVLFAGNTLSAGAYGAYFDDNGQGFQLVRNLTFADNVGGFATALIDGPVLFDSVVVARNGGPGVQAWNGAAATYSDVWGNGGGDFVGGLGAGPGTISVDPSFAAPSYALGAGSPCVDAGSPYVLDADGTRADMGAYGGPHGVW